MSGVAAGTITAGDELVSADAGGVATLAAAAGATDINNAHSVLGVAIDSVTSGQVVRIVPD